MRRLALPLLLVALPCRAFDPFEIQVYDGRASPPGVAGLEMHLNYTANGRRDATAPELAPHHQTHVTFEPSFGVTRFWELGAYLQFAYVPDGSIRAAGLKLRSKFIIPEGWHPHLRVGLNLELSRIPDAFSASRWGGELRPILAWEDGLLLVAANPNFGFAFSGEDQRPSFEPAASAKVKLAGIAAVGVEYYGSVGPPWDLAPAAEQEHYLFGAADLIGSDRLELNLGIGAGLTSGSNGLLLKAIVGWTFE